MRLDINCDMGEMDGSSGKTLDDELLKYVSSANIACGFHAGGGALMRRTVGRCLEAGVAIGAHPGLADREGFGRRKIPTSRQEAYDAVVYQIGALLGFVRAEGAVLRHVKPHGALYNMAAVDPELARGIAEAVYKVDAELVLYGLSGSELLRAGQEIGLRTASEVFADRTYEADGSLTSRLEPDALIIDPKRAVAQILGMVRSGTVVTRHGATAAIQADTVCVHGDGPYALEISQQIKSALESANILITAP